MSDLNIKILDLIDKKYTINEMIEELNISREQLYKAFRKMRLLGMSFNKKYYGSGDIIYSQNKEVYIPPKHNHVNIITEPNTDIFRAIFISDLHAGSEFECVDAWHKIYDYCILNNIHVILIVGDFLDGINVGRADSKLHTHPLEQMEYATRNYPFNKDILNFVMLGNHDLDSLASFGIDFAEYLNSFRHDIVPIGYGHGFVNIKNDKILLAHPLRTGVGYTHDLTSNYLLVKGHQHLAKTIISANCNCSLVVPSLSNLFLTENEFMPGAIDFTIKFRGGYFDTIYYEHLLVGDKIYAISSTQYNVMHDKNRNFDEHIKYEECLSKRKIKK